MYAYKNWQFMCTYVHVCIYVCWLLWLRLKVYKYFSFKQRKSLTTSTWTAEDTMGTKLQGARPLVQETYKSFIFKFWINCLLTEKLSFQIQWILQSMNLSWSYLNSGIVGSAIPLPLLMENHDVSQTQIIRMQIVWLFVDKFHLICKCDCLTMQSVSCPTKCIIPYLLSLFSATSCTVCHKLVLLTYSDKINIATADCLYL